MKYCIKKFNNNTSKKFNKYFIDTYFWLIDFWNISMSLKIYLIISETLEYFIMLCLCKQKKITLISRRLFSKHNYIIHIDDYVVHEIWYVTYFSLFNLVLFYCFKTKYVNALLFPESSWTSRIISLPPHLSSYYRKLTEMFIDY